MNILVSNVGSTSLKFKLFEKNIFSASQRLSEWEAATQFSIIEILRPDLRKEATAPSLAIPTALKCSFPV